MDKARMQELFDISVNHIRKQGGPAVGANGVKCMYRTAAGRGCAAAPFVRFPPEGLPVHHNTAPFRQIYESGLSVNVRTLGEFNFVKRLQYCHDMSIGVRDCSSSEYPSLDPLAWFETDRVFMQRYEARIAELAADYELTMPAKEA